MNDIELLTIQDGNGSYIGLDLLYYCKKMPTCFLTNLNTQLGIVNRAQIMVFGIILDLEGNT